MEAFGTKKSIKKVTSMMSNMVDEGGITNAANKGVRDTRLAQLAHHISDEQEVLKRDFLKLSDKRTLLYSREKLLPPELMADLPYKMTFEALRNEDEESLKSLMLNPLIRELL